jgi:hypothetical protein
VTPVYLLPPRTRRPRYPTCTNFAVLQIFGDNFVHNRTRHILTLFVHFANCEMSILSNDASVMTEGRLDLSASWTSVRPFLNIVHHFRTLSTLYWTHQMTDLVQWNNCAGCMRKHSLLSEQPSYMYRYNCVLHTIHQPCAWHETGWHRIHTLPHGVYIHSFIGAFALLRKASSCPSVRPHRITRLPLEGISCNFIFDFLKICRENWSFTKIW